MTTVVYKNGTLAFDSKITEGNIHTCNASKGRQTKNMLMAGAGDLEDLVAAFDWLEAGGSEVTKKDYNLLRIVNCDIITINKHGEVFHYSGSLYPVKTTAPWFALGSGQELAMGALEMGATAKEAVQIAAKYDVNTGGTIHTLSLKRLDKKKLTSKPKRKK